MVKGDGRERQKNPYQPPVVVPIEDELRRARIDVEAKKSNVHITERKLEALQQELKQRRLALRVAENHLEEKIRSKLLLPPST